jgi:hypothetical protein
MTASTNTDGLRHSNDGIKCREPGDCPVCGQAYTATRTELVDGREGAFSHHDTQERLIDLCVEFPDGSVREVKGRRQDWIGEQ